MSWPAIVTSTFSSMVGMVCPYSTQPLALSSTVSPWWSSYDVNEAMRHWLVTTIRDLAKCSGGTKFCALNQKCIPDDEPCTIHLTNDMLRNLTNTPWCAKCDADEFFCPLYMQCINVSESCSYENLFEWQKHNNFSVGPFGTDCDVNETFCIHNMSCIPNNTECKAPEISYTATRKKAEIVCKDQVFCPYTASCQNEADCVPAPSANYSQALDNDELGGWAHLCQMRNLVCPAVSHAVVKCAEARSDYDCNLCPDGHTFCNKSGLCLMSGAKCCATGHVECNATGVCRAPADCQDYTNCEPSSEGYIITFVFDADYNEISGGSEDTFRRRILEIVQSLTSSTCIQDLDTVPGSINVTFTIVPQKGQTTVDLQKAVSILEAQINSGNFNVTLPSGGDVTANPTSFTATLVTPTTAPTIAATAKPSDSKMIIIIICCVVGGVLLIVIIVITVCCCCCCSKRKEGRISPSVSKKEINENEDVEMRGYGGHNKDHPGSHNNRAVSM